MQVAIIFLFSLLVIRAFATENSTLESKTESAHMSDDVICLFQIRCFSWKSFVLTALCLCGIALLIVLYCIRQSKKKEEEMLTIRRLEEAAANRRREEMREIHKRNAERFHFYIQNNGPKEVF